MDEYTDFEGTPIIDGDGNRVYPTMYGNTWIGEYDDDGENVDDDAEENAKEVDKRPSYTLLLLLIYCLLCEIVAFIRGY